MQDVILVVLRLGMPLDEGRFAETVCQQLGIRRNTGQRGRPAKDKESVSTALPGQTDFGF